MNEPCNFGSNDVHMNPGTLVRFTVYMYHDWGIGTIIRSKTYTDRDGRVHSGYYEVFTQQGIKVVHVAFMESIQS